MTAGSELRQARERAGISAEQISERTKIQLFKIEALERNQYAQLPQGIYLDGIVRAYAREVSIDPEPIVERVRAERGRLPGDWEVPFAAPIDLRAPQEQHEVPDLDDIPVLDRPSGGNVLEGFTAESELKAAPAAAREYQPSIVPRAPEPTVPPRPISVPDPDLDLAVADLDPADDVRLDSDLPRVKYPAGTLVPPPPSRRQPGGMLLPILILLAAAGLGIYFYQAARALNRETATAENTTGTKSTRDTNDDVTADAKPAAPDAKADGPVPFSENVILPEDNRRAASDGNAHAVPRDTPSISDTVATPTRSVPTAGSRPAASNAPAANASASRVPASRAPVSRAPAPAAAASSIPASRAPAAEPIAPASSSDVTGSWQLATQIESSSYARYTGLKLGYEMQLEQDGDRITGTGRKVSENGSGVRGKARTPVTVNGTINGGRLTLNFVERGARRPTQGKFVLLLEEDGRLRGRFSSDAARSSGLVEAHRVSAQ